MMYYSELSGWSACYLVCVFYFLTATRARNIISYINACAFAATGQTRTFKY